MAFNIMDLMNGATRAAVEGVENYEEIRLNLEEIEVTKHNRYSMDELEELATSILMDGLQEPLIIGRVNGKYLLSGGHRRREALKILKDEGHEEITKAIPCRFKDMTETQFRLSLLIGNTFNRKMTDYDLMNQAADWKEVLTQARKEKLLVLEEGKRVRDYVAAVLGEKPTKIAQLEAINNNATEEVKEQFEKGNMKITSAYETSRLSEDAQKEVAAAVEAGADIKSEEIKQMSEEKKKKRKAIVSAIFGIMDKTTGYRQFREVFIIVARKNGKTLFAAAIAAYMTYVDGEYGAKVYFLAPKLDQADLVYDAFYQIVQSDDELDSITKKRRSDIYIKAFNTSVKKIAFNSKKSDGFNPQLVVNDEMEAWPGDQGLKQYEVMTSALGARKQPLIISIATAGYVNDGIFDELFKRATAFLKGNSREKRLLPFIYMIDDIEKWDSIEELKKSNPNLGVSVSAEYYLEQIEIARNSISKKVEFMTKFCNIKQNSAVAWLDYWDVMKCVHEEKPLSLEDFKGCYCVGGIDLSRTTDLTAASIVINRDGINHIFTRFYMPQKRYEVAINEDNTPYNIYRDRGFLFISGENQVDYKDVYNWFIELVKVYKIKPLKIGYDRYSANYLVEDLKTAGFHTDDVYQGTNLTPVLHEFEGNLKDGLFDFGDNSMLAAHFLNVAVDINLNDSRMKPVKIEKRMRIDGAMSVFDALTMVSKYHNEIGKKLLNISKETA